MLRKSLCVGVVFLAGVLGAVSAVQAVTYSLANDFSYTNNSDTSIWSYRTGSDGASWGLTETYPLLMTTSNANTVWGSAFPTSPTLAGDGNYWGIGKNTTGSDQVWAGYMTWKAGDVMFHPGNSDTSHYGLVVSWLAPATGTADLAMTLTREFGDGWGDSVGYSVAQRSGATDTLLQGLTHTIGPNAGDSVSYSQTVSVTAGNRVFFRIDNGANAGWDITKADITVTLTPIPEPGTLALLASGLIGLIAYAWRKHK